MSAPPHAWVVCEGVVANAMQRMCSSIGRNVADAASWPLPGSGGALVVRASAGSEGRTVHAARPLARASLVLEAHAYALIVGPTHCRQCMSNDIDKSCRCEICHQQFCSRRCADQWMPMHRASRECDVMLHLRSLFHTRAYRKGQAKLNPGFYTCEGVKRAAIDVEKEDAMDFCLLGATLARAFAERFRVGDAVKCGLPDSAFEGGVAPSLTWDDHAPNLISGFADELDITFADVASLTTNATAFTGKKLARPRKWYELYRNLVSDLPDLFPSVTQQMFLNLCMANQCNTYGMWAPVTDFNIGQGLFPLASYMNHSCAPNIFHPGIAKAGLMQYFALRDIAEGEEITISYTDPRYPELMRRETLQLSQMFTCGCPRCTTERRRESYDHLFNPKTALCQKCTSRGYIVPSRVMAQFFGKESVALHPEEDACFDCGSPTDTTTPIAKPSSS